MYKELETVDRECNERKCRKKRRRKDDGDHGQPHPDDREAKRRGSLSLSF